MPRETEPMQEMVELLCNPDAPAPVVSSARKRLAAICGPMAEPLLQACAQAAAANQRSAKMAADLERLFDGAQLVGTVIGFHDGRARVQLGPVDRLLVQPPELTLRLGDTVVTDAEGRTIVDTSAAAPMGTSFSFCELVDDGPYVLVRPQRDGVVGEGRQLGILADTVERGELRTGDVVLGTAVASGNLVLVHRRLGPATPTLSAAPPPRVVRREDVVGLDEQIAELELLFLASEDPAYAAILEVIDPGLTGRLLEGPPGCGKTLVALLLMQTVRERGGAALYRTGSYFLNAWVGGGPRLLRQDFEALEASYQETGVRPLLVIDELEAIALSRTSPTGSHGGYVDVLDELLGLLTRSPVRVLGISNVARTLIDPALLREGRLQVLRFPETLAPEQVVTLVERTLAGVARADGSAREYGEVVSDMLFATSGALAELVRVQLADGSEVGLGAADFTTGAAIVDGVLRPTLGRWIKEDLRAGRRPRPLPLEALRDATVAHFVERAHVVTAENAHAMFPERIPREQRVTRVQVTAGARHATTRPPRRPPAAA